MSADLTSPCPFCASHCFYVLEVDEGAWAVICDGCKSMGPAAKQQDEAVQLWNLRMSQAPAKSLQDQESSRQN
jgi:hypothetical protein